MASSSTNDWVADHLRRRGLLSGDAITVAPLTGGVSAEIFEAASGTTELVVKRPRPRLDVAQDWYADVDRIVTEARALEEASRLVPAAVPRVVDFDPDTEILTLERAPRSWSDWRSSLFAGEGGDGVTAALGASLATWHRETATPGIRASFGSKSGFEELRIDPFHRAVAAEHPELARPISAVVDRLRGEQVCLVHGDFSPKNVLYGVGGVWVLDWEVAHCGAPVFDLAFMLMHLTLKAVHDPARGALHAGLAADFIASYQAHGGVVRIDDPGLDAQVGCLLLARVDGKSPAGYLTADERDATRELAIALLLGESHPAAYARLWEA